jgi:DNA-binding LacI/PurR family transcriptional regulator
MSSTKGNIPGSANITMRDIALQCNVSVMTVSRALRHDPLVRTETSERILRAAEELGYNPAYHDAARRLAGRRSGKRLINRVISLVFHHVIFPYPYWSMLFRGVLDTLAAHHYSLLVTYREDMETYPIPPIISRGEVDALIMFMMVAHEHELTRRIKRHVPYADFPMITMVSPQPGCASVLADDFRGGYLLTEHLLRLGHRRLLHFWEHPGPMYTYTQREAGCRQACRDAGLDPEDLLVRAQLDLSREFPQRIAHPLHAALRAHPQITGIIAPNDRMAGMIHALLTDQGVRVPQDISLVGFDDSDPLLDEQGNNCLTTIRVPIEALGAAAARLAIDLVEGVEQGTPTRTLPVELMVRATTAPPDKSGG